jgi:hypothetical protein
MPGALRTAIGITGNTGAVETAPFADLPGVAECVRVTKPYKLVSRELRPEKTVVRIRNAEIGGGKLAIIGGVCAVESREQTMATAELVAASGCTSSEAERSSLALRPMHFRVSARKASRSSQRSATGTIWSSSPRQSTKPHLSWSSATVT